MNRIDFLKIALKDFKRVATIFPSSPHVARRIAAKVANRRLVMEYGAGDGAISRQILAALSPQGRLIALEINPIFVLALRALSDRRLEVINEDALTYSERLVSAARPTWSPEVVISGIPFSFLPKTDRERIVKNTHRLLPSGGIFIVYQHSLASLPCLKKFFRRIKVTFEPRNILPYLIIESIKD